MAQIIKTHKPLATQPIKSGQPLGAILASLGIDRCIPLIHGAQGCSAFAKIFFIQHFSEPIPLQSTAMDPITTVMGSDENIIQALAHLCEKSNPRLVVLLSSGLSEAQGTDMNRALKEFRRQYPKFERNEIVTVNTPDFYGSLENGYSALVESLISQLVPEQKIRSIRKKRINLLLSHMLTPGDIELIRQYAEAFGLQPILVPDLSRSMDGHLVKQDYLSVSQGGTDVNMLRQLGQSSLTLVVGPSMQRAGQLLSSRSGVESVYFPHLMTLAEMDRFIQTLQQVSDRQVPEWIDRQRGQVTDTMIDTHTWVNDTRVAIGAEADLLVAWLAFAESVGMQPVSVVAPVNQPCLAALSVDKVLIGDLEDLQQQAEERGCDLLLANSHGAVMAEQLKLPLMRIGFPIFDRFGDFRRVRQGYAGIRDNLFEIANYQQQACHGRPVYHSPLKQPFAQAPLGAEEAFA
ncbi:nitrogenase iron-molybdenum cofactor biosynthesis protein NifN [Tolumonas auensis]|uniref:nitrogenase iron-molybdenum cofactor biosynthesis protein NifN n=1 Tax=Tolumonas auensis TaxID=43948 RepID=UPI002AA83D21|nr:nitrogenase iron-molybdenum cofactor biosynthesis protein NifN [Tolumonas auensis]